MSEAVSMASASHHNHIHAVMCDGCSYARALHRATREASTVQLCGHCAAE